MDEKMTGYVLLTLGVIVMVFGLIQLGLLVTRVIKPFPTFAFSEVFMRLDQAAASGRGQVLPNAPVPEPTGSARTTVRKASPTGESPVRTDVVVSPAVVNEVLNFGLYILFTTLLSQMGYKLASLGVRLIRPITVKLNASDIEYGKPGNPPSYVAPAAQSVPFA